MKHRRYLKVLFFAVFFSFVWGLWWGYYQRYKNRPDHWAKGELNVLAEAGRFDPSFVERFSRSEKVILKVTEKETPQELLRELLSRRQEYDLIQISSFLADSFMFDNVFAELDDQRIRHFKNISVDFLNLSLDDENRFVIPVFWGVNGFVYSAEEIQEPDSLMDLLVNPTLKSKVSILPSAVELFTYASHIKPIVKTWVKTGNQDGVSQELKAVKELIAQFEADPFERLQEKKLMVAQSSNGEAAEFLAKNPTYRFFTPRERANLWVGLLGIAKDSKKKRLAEQTIGHLLSDKWNAEFVRTSRTASVLTTLNTSDDLLPLAKAQFVREIRLSRFELFYDRETFEPVWSNAIRTVYPDLWESLRAKTATE